MNTCPLCEEPAWEKVICKACSVAINAFWEKVCARAENKMLLTNKLEGSHYNAAQELIEEFNQ